MCQLSPAYASSLVSTPFPSQSSILQVILVMETHGRWRRGEFCCGNTSSSSLLPWRHVDFTKLSFWTFVINVWNTQLLHEMNDRQVSIQCSIETKRTAAIRHFINSTFRCRIIDSHGNPHGVTCFRVRAPGPTTTVELLDCPYWLLCCCSCSGLYSLLFRHFTQCLVHFSFHFFFTQCDNIGNWYEQLWQDSLPFLSTFRHEHQLTQVLTWFLDALLIQKPFKILFVLVLNALVLSERSI